LIKIHRHDYVGIEVGERLIDPIAVAFQVRVALALQAGQVRSTGECYRRYLNTGTGEL
jgi:hypothetical protein